LVPEVAANWCGERLAGKSVLVYGEQGVGDEVMFAANFPMLVEQAERVVISCDSRLVPLFQRSFPRAYCLAHETLAKSEVAAMNGAVDFQIAAGSVPQYVRSELEASSASERYLTADPEKRAAWQQRLAALGPGLRVGISWRGGSGTAETLRRSTSIADWQRVLQVNEVQFINLQYGVSRDELAELGSLAGREIHHWPESEGLVDLDSFAALVSQLDLVISIDNTTAHIAGALGVQAWVLLSFPSSSYWRWLHEGERSAWYRNAFLFRKTRSESWQRIMDEVAVKLGSLR
jgi:hypothetical protein